MRNKNPIDRQPVLVASIMRITATLLIFLFHFLCLSGFKTTYQIDKIGIFFFILISGYFSFQSGISPLKWFIKRIKQILIPYWLVISVVLIANSYIDYKDTDFLKNLIIFFGGSLFLENPVYVISWFITYILLLYFCVFVYYTIKFQYMKYFFIFLVAVLFYTFKIGNIYYFVGFFSGLFFRTFREKQKNVTYNNHQNSKNNIVSHYLFIIQSHSYSFFLIHGGILQLVFHVFLLTGLSAFTTSFFMTAIISIYHKMLSDRMLRMSFCSDS
jgi:hypothetical protein